MLSEPPGADPHAGWCGRGQGEPGLYPILRGARRRKAPGLPDKGMAREGGELAIVFVALRSSGAWQADVCFHDCDNATRPGSDCCSGLSPQVVRRPVAWSQPPAASLSKHYAARGSLVLGLAKQHCFCLNANSDLHRLPHHRGDAAVSRAARRVDLVLSRHEISSDVTADRRGTARAAAVQLANTRCRTRLGQSCGWVSAWHSSNPE